MIFCFYIYNSFPSSGEIFSGHSKMRFPPVNFAFHFHASVFFHQPALLDNLSVATCGPTAMQPRCDTLINEFCFYRYNVDDGSEEGHYLYQSLFQRSLAPVIRDHLWMRVDGFTEEARVYMYTSWWDNCWREREGFYLRAPCRWITLYVLTDSSPSVASIPPFIPTLSYERDT